MRPYFMRLPEKCRGQNVVSRGTKCRKWPGQNVAIFGGSCWWVMASRIGNYSLPAYPSPDRPRVSRCRAGDPLPDGRKRPAGVFQLRAFFFASSLVRCDPVRLVFSRFVHGSPIGGSGFFRGSFGVHAAAWDLLLSVFSGRFSCFVRASSLVVRIPSQVVRLVCKFRKVASHICPAGYRIIVTDSFMVFGLSSSSFSYSLYGFFVPSTLKPVIKAAVW